MARRSYRVRFPGGNGFELAGIVDRDDQANLAEGPAPVVVFSHCFTCNKDLKAIVRIGRGLADAGLTVLRYDMTGLGGSEGDFSATNFTTNLADLRAAIGFATSELGPVHCLLGHSFGGAASMQMAAQRNQENGLADLTSVVTLAAPSDTSHLADLLVHMDPRIDSAGQGEVNIGGRRWTITRQMVDDFRAHRLTAAIPEIDVPTLIFHSPIDETVHYDHSVRIQSLLNTRAHDDAIASLITIPGGDHLLVREPTDLTWVAATTATFVKRFAGSMN